MGIRVAFVLLGAAVGAGCAAVAGLGDFEIVDCPADCDGGEAIRPDADGGVDAGLDGGGDAGVDAGPTFDAAVPAVPSCTVTQCGGLSSSSCSAEPCSGNAVWQTDIDAGNSPGAANAIEVGANRCRAEVQPNQQGFLAHTLAGAGSTRYALDFRVTFQELFAPEAKPATIVAILFGGTVGLRLELTPIGLSLCNATDCVDAQLDVRNANLTNVAVSLSAGVAQLAVGSATCSPVATIPLPALGGDPSVEVGCIVTSDNCKLQFSDALFSAQSY